MLSNWCLRRLLRVPWTARRSSQSILKEINPEYTLEGLMLKLKLQYFSHLMRRTNSLEKTVMLGKIEGRRRGWQKMKWLDSLTYSMNMNLSKLHGTVKDKEVWHDAVHGWQRVWNDLVAAQQQQQQQHQQHLIGMRWEMGDGRGFQVGGDFFMSEINTRF